MRSKINHQFIFDANEIDKISGIIDSYLQSMEMACRDILKIRLSIEEMLIKLLPTSEGNEGTVCIRWKWGRPDLLIKIKGTEPGPGEEDEFEEYAANILENLNQKPETYHKAGCNYIHLALPRKVGNPLVNIFASAMAAVIIGLVANICFPASIAGLNSLVTPLMDTFLGILSTLAGPMIFLSVVWGIVCIGDATTLGAIGKKLIVRFVILTFIITALAYLLGSVIYNLRFDDATIDAKQFYSIFDMILNILPDNCVAPFYNNNSMQIIVMAIAVGIAILILEQRAKVVAELVQQANEVVQMLMGLVTKLIPFFVFLGVLQTLLSDSAKQLTSCWTVILSNITLCVALLVLLTIYTAIKYKAGIINLLKKLMPTFLIGLTTASSVACFSTSVDCCEKELGINSKLTNFGIPLGMVMYMPCLGINLILISVYMAYAYGVSISISWVIVAILASAILAIAVPPIPGGALTCYTILFAQLGIPAEAIAIATIIDIILDFVSTACSMPMLQLELVHQADSMKLLDKTKLQADVKD